MNADIKCLLLEIWTTICITNIRKRTTPTPIKINFLITEKGKGFFTQKKKGDQMDLVIIGTRGSVGLKNGVNLSM